MPIKIVNGIFYNRRYSPNKKYCTYDLFEINFDKYRTVKYYIEFDVKLKMKSLKNDKL